MSSTPISKYYFCASNDSIYDLMKRGIWHDMPLNHEIEPIDSATVLQVRNDETEVNVTAARLNRCVRLITDPESYLKKWSGNIASIFLVQVDPNIVLRPDTLTIKRMKDGVIEYLKNISVHVSSIQYIHVCSQAIKNKLDSISPNFGIPVVVSANLFGVSNHQLDDDFVIAKPGIYYDGSNPSELHYICSIADVPSMLENGILSHKRVQKLKHSDISDQEVQKLRAKTVVVNPDRIAAKKTALVIHRCANLYFRAQNAMMYDIMKQDPRSRDRICVLRIDPRILQRDEVVIANKNASRKDSSFHKASTFRFSQESSSMLLEDLSLVYSDIDTPKLGKRKAVCQSEVLIPYKLNPSYIQGIYVANATANKNLYAQIGNYPIPVDMHPTLFFPEKTEVIPNRGSNPLKRICPPMRNDRYSKLVEDPATSSEEETYTQNSQ